MFDFSIKDIAAPNARVANLNLNGKQNQTPTYYPTLTRKTEPDRVLETFQELDEAGGELLPRIGGFVVESQDAPDVLNDFQEPRQAVLGGNNFSNFASLLEDLSRVLVIEPNIDRLLYWAYRQDIDAIAEYLPPSIEEVDRLLSLDDNHPEAIGFQDAYDLVRENMDIEEFATRMVELQEDFEADVVLAPYIPLKADSVEEDLATNINLYKKAKDLSEKPVEPVIPLKKSVIGADADNTNGRIHSPQIWIDIIQEYRKLEPDILYLKATNAEFDPDTLHKTDNQGIYQFFSLLRRYTNRPTFFLGLDELAYILTQDGLDGYSRPLYKNPYRMPITNGDGGNQATPHRKFLLPRDWSWVKFDQINNLGCNCHFCNQFQGIAPQEIELADQDSLRMSHWLWLRDEEMDEIHEAIAKDEVRPGLQSICEDSEWKKNFTTFI